MNEFVPGFPNSCQRSEERRVVMGAAARSARRLLSRARSDCAFSDIFGSRPAAGRLSEPSRAHAHPGAGGVDPGATAQLRRQ